MLSALFELLSALLEELSDKLSEDETELLSDKLSEESTFSLELEAGSSSLQAVSASAPQQRVRESARVNSFFIEKSS